MTASSSTFSMFNSIFSILTSLASVGETVPYLLLHKETLILTVLFDLKPDPGSHYTAWSSMSTLTRKGFIIKTNNPAR